VHPKEHETRNSSNSPALILLAIPAFLFFVLVVLVSGVIRSAMSFFQAYFIIALHDGDQTGKDQAAFVALARVVSEVGVYFFGKQLLHALGPYWMLIISQGTGILRMLGYAAMPTKGAGSWIFPYFLELLKGLNAGLFSSSAVRLACDMAPESCGNTAQGIVAGTYAGLSTVLGGVIGGFIVSFFPSTIEGERRGMQTMFFILSGSGFVFLALFILKYWMVDGLLCTRPRSHS
jgi:Na+/melibiose symporter-like transporter